MVAYIIFTKERTRDAAELEIYSKKAGASMGGHKLTPRVIYGKHEMLEGAAIEGAVVLEFPTFEEAKTWYNSPAYGEARRHRNIAADYRAFIVEGV